MMNDDYRIMDYDFIIIVVRFCGKKFGEYMYKNLHSLIISITLVTLLFGSSLIASDWKHHPGMFNPSGVPSLPFTQPRFADMDADGDMDMILGSTSGAPVYISNIGSSTSPQFSILDDLFSDISELDAEMAVAHDIDADGDLDLITGGYRGLNLYENTGNAVFGSFNKVNDFFSGITVGSNPVVDMGDIDNDGDLDLVVGFSESGAVKLFTNSGSDTAAVFLESSAQTLGDLGLYAYPVFCDPDSDGDLDILCGQDGHYFTYFQNDGNATSGTWNINASTFNGLGTDTYFNSPAIVDINGDGKQDLIYGNYTGPLTYYRNSGSTTSASWTKNTSLFGGVIDIGGASTPFFYDHDADGDMDMYTGSQMGDIKLIRNNGTREAATFKYLKSFSALKHSIYSFVSITDVTGDGNLDALVGDLSGNIYYHTGTSIGFVGSSSALSISDIGDWSAPRFVDMDNDGDQDIVAGNGDGFLFYFKNEGSASQPLWSEQINYFDSLDVGSNCVPALTDLDYDGDMDLLIGGGFHKIRYFENVDGDWIEDTSMVSGITAGQNAAPAFADLDYDGDQDLILGNYDGYFEYYENLRPVVAIDPGSTIPNDFDLRAYPNPFNPQTAISFQLSADSDVELAIYDLTGRKITTIINGKHSAGTHSVNYSANESMSTGIYFIRLLVNGQTAETKKITLLK